MDQLTVKIAREDLPPRILRISASTIDRLSRWMWTAILITVVSLTLAVALGWRLWRISQAPVAQAPAVSLPQPTAAVPMDTSDPRPLPATTPITAVPSTETTIPTSETAAPRSSAGFELASSQKLKALKLPDASLLRFRLDPVTVQRAGRKVKVRSSLTYTATDSGKQEGRIWILVFGPNHLAAYPEGSLEGMRGETFSVSRYRAIEADIDLADYSLYREVWVLITDSNAKPLVARKVQL
jgi:hypothetical protein